MVRKRKDETQKPVSGVSKELSGAQKLKRQKLQEEETKKLQKAALKYFKPIAAAGPTINSNETTSTADEGLVDSDSSPPTSSISNSPQPNVSSPSPTSTDQAGSSGANLNNSNDIIKISMENVQGIENENVGDNVVEEIQRDIDVLDPSTWIPVLSDLQRSKILISTAKYEPEESYEHLTAYKIWKRHYIGKMPNQETITRDWMRISKINDSIYCLPCCFYAPVHLQKTSWSKYGSIGFKKFHHPTRGIKRHEKSECHRESMISWKHYLSLLNNPLSLAAKINMQASQNITEWRLVLRGVVDGIMFLAHNNIAFQGHKHDIHDADCGVFLNLIKLLAKYYEPLRTHVERLRKNSVSYLSPKSQNEFILLCGNHIQKKIISNIQQRKYFSIMFDSTPDVSHREQISQIIRSVECSELGCKIQENFLDFISSTAKTGEDLAAVILAKIEKDKLEMKNCRGQGYDNGANMAGAYKGVQARINSCNPEAIFVPCAAHSLNLVGVNAAEKVLSAKLLLGTIQNLYGFFAASPARWEFLLHKVTKTLKAQSATRWSSKADAVGALFDNYGEIIEALAEVSTSDTFKSDVIAAAESRMRDISNFKFLLGLSIWNQILFQINVCNVSLQSKMIDVSVAEKKLSVLCQWLNDFKNSGFEMCVTLAESEAKKFGISLDSGFNYRRGRGVNPKYDDPKIVAEVREMDMHRLDRFKHDFFDKLVGILIKEMSDRFHQIRQSVVNFGFLWGNGLSLNIEEKQKRVLELSSKYKNDLDPATFVKEMLSFSLTVNEFLEDKSHFEKLTPIEVLNILYKNGLETSYLNCATALRIFLTLPVSVASNERAFSKLKLIKNYLRSSMGQERLSGLAIISIEREAAKKVDYDEIIDQFVAKKCRRVCI